MNTDQKRLKLLSHYEDELALQFPYNLPISQSIDIRYFKLYLNDKRYPCYFCIIIGGGGELIF